MKTIGQKIEFLREEKKINQDALSKIIGVSSAAISKWEQDVSKPKAESVIKLSEYFSVNLETLTKHDKPITYKKSLVAIRFYPEVVAAAGCGFDVLGEDYDEVCIQAGFIKNPQSTISIKIKGDSMTPVFFDGAVVFVDRSVRTIVDGQVYVFVQENLVRIKILVKTMKGYILKSYNRDYPNESIDTSKDDFNLIGKVVAQIQTY